METTINMCIKVFQESADEECFNKVYNHCLPTFNNWYKRVHRHTRLDRSILFSEFQYVILKTVKKFDTSNTITNGFLRYFRAALKKHTYSLWKDISSIPKMRHIKKTTITESKSYVERAKIETLDIINSCLKGNSKELVMMRLSGDESEEIKEKLGLSEFRYRTMIHNIKGNSRLRQSLLM